MSMSPTRRVYVSAAVTRFLVGRVVVQIAVEGQLEVQSAAVLVVAQRATRRDCDFPAVVLRQTQIDTVGGKAEVDRFDALEGSLELEAPLILDRVAAEVALQRAHAAVVLG